MGDRKKTLLNKTSIIFNLVFIAVAAFVLWFFFSIDKSWEGMGVIIFIIIFIWFIVNFFMFFSKKKTSDN